MKDTWIGLIAMAMIFFLYGFYKLYKRNRVLRANHYIEGISFDSIESGSDKSLREYLIDDDFIKYTHNAFKENQLRNFLRLDYYDDEYKIAKHGDQFYHAAYLYAFLIKNKDDYSLFKDSNYEDVRYEKPECNGYFREDVLTDKGRTYFAMQVITGDFLCKRKERELKSVFHSKEALEYEVEKYKKILESGYYC